MSLEYVLTGLAGCAVFVYLVFVLVNPEKL